jgi:hypothetical protein
MNSTFVKKLMCLLTNKLTTSTGTPPLQMDWILPYMDPWHPRRLPFHGNQQVTKGIPAYMIRDAAHMPAMKEHLIR